MESSARHAPDKEPEHREDKVLCIQSSHAMHLEVGLFPDSGRTTTVALSDLHKIR